MDNELIFWVAYRKGHDNKCHYLGDGKGNIRLFKTLVALQTYLDEVIPEEMRPEIIVDFVVGKIIVPEPQANDPILMPITTLARTMQPTAIELLENYEKRKQK